MFIKIQETKKKLLLKIKRNKKFNASILTANWIRENFIINILNKKTYVQLVRFYEFLKKLLIFMKKMIRY